MEQTPKPQATDASKTMRKEFFSWFLYILAAIVVALLLRFFVVEPVQVDGSSMLPTLANHETLLVEKISDRGNIAINDIIIVSYPEMEGAFVKRVIGRPGDRLSIQNGILYRNGEAVAEDFILESPMARDMKETVVPQDHYFVMGDNRNDSLDSRSSSIGPIHKNAVIGHAFLVIWPISGIRFL